MIYHLSVDTGTQNVLKCIICMSIQAIILGGLADSLFKHYTIMCYINPIIKVSIIIMI